MKDDENRIPYIGNILLLITLIEHDVILWVFGNHVMTRDVLRIINLLHLFLSFIKFCKRLHNIEQCYWDIKVCFMNAIIVALTPKELTLILKFIVTSHKST